MKPKLLFVLSAFLVISSCAKPINPEPTKTVHLDVAVTSDGYDIYQMPQNHNGYRYGPAIMVHEHEGSPASIDAWFATSGFDTQLWDVFSYRHSDDAGETWSEEKVVTWPTPKSLDTYSVCDPAVIKINQYYYMGYTSTYNSNQRDNCAYVARSTSPEGPWDKWNGSSWGGKDPQPIVYWDQYGIGSTSYWGSGEPSFVVKDNVIYVYYTYEGSGGRETRVLTGDATSENWPATLAYKGIALGAGNNDSIDVAYVEEYNKFMALGTDERFTENSYLAIYESDDGITFTLCDVVKENTCRFLHNSGLSKNELGHITKTMSPIVGYAYGGGSGNEHWGIWNTRFQNISITSRENIDLSDLKKSNKLVSIVRDTRSASSRPSSGILCYTPNSQSDEYACYYGVTSSMELNVYTYNSFRSGMVLISTADAVRDLTYSDYDESVITPTNGSRTVRINGVGTTQLVVNWRGFHTITKFRVVQDNSTQHDVKSVEPMVKLDSAKNYKIDLSNMDNCQPKVLVTYNDGTWKEMTGSDVTYSNYNSNIISLNTTTGNVRAKAVGTSTLTMTVGGKSTTVNIIVSDQGMETMDFTDYNKAPMTKLYVKESETSVLKNKNQATKINLQRGYLRLTSTGDDPFIIIDNSLGNIKPSEYAYINIEYKIEGNKSSYVGGLYFASRIDGFNATDRTSFPLTPKDDYQTIKVPLSEVSGWNNNMKYMRFDYLENGNTGDVLCIKKITFSN